MKRIIYLFLTLILAYPAYGEVLLVHDLDNNTSRLFSNRISAYLDNTPIRTIRVSDFLETTSTSSDIVIGLGFPAFKKICHAKHDAFLIGILLGEDEYLATKSSCSVDSTAVYSGAPLDLRLSLLKTILPYEKRLGLIYNNQLALDIGKYQETAVEYGFHFVFRATPNDRFSVIKSVNSLLSETDVLFSIIDSELYQPEIAQDVLRLMFRQRKMMIGPSDNFVKAGALISIYSDVESQLAETAELIKTILNNTNALALVPPRYPKPFKIVFNPYLVRSFGLVLPSTGYLENTFGLCAESGCTKTSD